MAGEQYEIYESGTAAALAGAQLALLGSKADKTGTYSTLTAGGTTPDSITDAMLVQTGGVLSRVHNLRADLDSITIENYEHPFVEDDTPVTSGAYYAIINVVVSYAGYSYKEIECEPNTTYVISGCRGTDARLYIVLDGSRQVIDSAESYPHPDYVTMEYTTPANAAYLIVNSADSRGLPSIKGEDKQAFVLDSGSFFSVTHNGDVYTIAGEQYGYVVNLSGSNNGLFNFVSMSRAGASFKTCNDDTTPVSLVGPGYVGANHGYYFGYACTITSHGLTESDIGKTSTDGTNTWVLLKVNNANSITVGCYDESSWYRLKAIAPTTLDFGTSLSVESATRSQIYPSVKNGNVDVVETTHNKCLILETYDIIDIGVGIEALIVNVGSNTNDSLVALSDSAVTVRNLYEFHENGSVTIYQNLKVLKDYVALNFYGGVQSMAFGENDSYSVPQTTKRGIWPAGGTQFNFERSTWDDSTVPPTVYIQYDGNASTMRKAMFTGFVGGNRNADIAASGYAGYIATSQKMYPYMVHPLTTLDAGKTYSMVSFRVPASLHEVTSSVAFVAYTYVYDDIYLIVRSGIAINASIKLPEFMWGKRCEVVMADNMTCETTNVIDSLDVRGTQYCTLVVKLSD